MDAKVVLITGCSSGIGLSLAVRLASDPQKAFKVYATMRNLSKKERLLESVKGLHKDTLDILQMDVTSQQSILEATARIVEKRIDILVCNAGVGLMGPLEVQSLESMRKILEVNLLGTIQTIQAFLPDMKARGKGHILVTGSTGGLHGLPFNEVYCASKFAVEGACESLAILLQHFNIHVSLIECGPVNTDFLANLQKAEVGDVCQNLDKQTLALYEKYLQHCDSVFQNSAQDTEDIVKVFQDAIQSPNPAFRYFTSDVVPPLTKLKVTEPDGSRYISTMSKIIFSTEEQ
ncbi:estradiol 17-beta-dehydrogenase 1 [Takifugu flavidus]|uniref:estradiol 17-beta-dehydrogenase 1 n=1 Tax=Takifugu flavidus TaxID=433684 RepID=UPI0025441044|nr:estradiol 17-beta-dehydrogenase 1 [Takifugu flavidus]